MKTSSLCRLAWALTAGTMLATAASWAQGPSRASDQRDALAEAFADPPESARPRVWWHWMNGNVTKEGIEKDLDWMQRIGIGGVQNFDVNLRTPQIVRDRLSYMTDAWKDAFRHAVRLADDKGMEFAIAASPGWSETGGPWVKPQDGMKKLVWATLDVKGGKRVAAPLPSPPAITGPFQTARLFDPLLALSGEAQKPPSHYADVAVLAYPLDVASLPRPTASGADGKPVDPTALLDQDLESVVALPKGDDAHPALLDLEYRQPVTVRSATLFVPHARPPFGQPQYLPVLEAEQKDGWRRIGVLPLAEVPTTIGFAPVTARRFRLVMASNGEAKGPPPMEGAPGAIAVNLFGQAAQPTIPIGDFRLMAEAKVDQFEAKAGFAVVPDYHAIEGGGPAAAPAIDPAKVIDLTARVRPDGTLDWAAPAGSNWRILRLGYSLLGKTNHPATAEATGLEVDKYDPLAVRRYIEAYLAMYREAVGPEWMGKRGIGALLTDSIEVGASNWTPALMTEFRARRGYDPRPWLPVLTGVLLGSAAQSDAFLRDFRQTLSELVAESHYGAIAAVAHEHGLKVYGEALETGRPVLGDDMAMRRYADVPMAALWMFNRGSAPRPSFLGDMKGASSVGHIYGQNLIAAESMTSIFAPWASAPSDLKRVIDLAFAYGINRPVIHSSVHQPVDDKLPGLSLMVFGQYFNRHESWAEMAKPWMDYMARTAFLLQQGRNHADIAYFHGDDAPLTALFERGPPANLPVRYAYDFVSGDVLATALSVDAGEIVTAGGARYKALYLGGVGQPMTLRSLRRLAELAENGATIIGERPQYLRSLADDPAAFDALAGRLWSGGPITQIGQGRVIAHRDVEAALGSIGVGPDFAYAKPHPDSEVLFVHRTLGDVELYFVNNRRARAEKLEARFRVSGRQPELWRATSGTVEPLSYRIEGNETVVPLELGAEDAFFVVFRKPASRPSVSLPGRTERRVAVITTPWTVQFQSGRGAPDSIEMPSLKALDQHETPGIRYFSGTATYRTQFTLPKHVKLGEPLWIDLGKVGDVAKVSVNGRAAGTAWLSPYRLDIGKQVVKGANMLEIRVANLWVNRLIGDQQPGDEKIGFTTVPTYRPDAPLRPAGLMGPVMLFQME